MASNHDFNAGYVQDTDEPEIAYKGVRRAPIPMPDDGHYEDPEAADHCHEGDEEDEGVDKKARKKLMIASALCFVFMICEVLGGYMAGSLAVMTDAAHLLTDLASFMISLLAMHLAPLPPSRKMSFGWNRAEMMGALISVLMIWLITGILVYVAVMRIVHHDYEVDGAIMLITSALAVVFNLTMLAVLHGTGHGHSHGGGASHGHGHSHGGSQEQRLEAGENGEHCDPAPAKPKHKENVNVRAAFIHVIGDLLQAVGVLIAALIIYFRPDLGITDPICTFMFSVFVLFTTIAILRETLQVLMEGTPPGLDFNEVNETMHRIPGVREVHNLRVWSLSTKKTAASVHLVLENQEDSVRVLRVANRLLRRQFFLSEVTIQLEQYVPEMDNCKKCKDSV